MSATKMPTKSGGKVPKSNDCGCGGQKPWGGSAGASPCTCEDQPPACPTSGVLRPNFFAGQLLTEDDLQQITAYSSGKRRLTNRYVFGTGVVCGLKVCPAGPQAPGSIIVEPGYALDCCGNDIVLSCPYTIDVNAMVRALGLDCGDPCAQASGGSDQPRKYLLCVSYTECISDPVSPYSPGATTTCVNTRVQESCSFTLRCPPKECKPQCDLGTCLGHVLATHEAESGFAVDLARWRDLSEYKESLLAEPPPINLKREDCRALGEAQGQIEHVTKYFPRLSSPEEWNEEKLIAAVEQLRVPARTVARLLFFSEEERSKVCAEQSPDTGAGGDTATPATERVNVNAQLNQLCGPLAEAAKLLGSFVRDSFSPAARVRANLLVHEILRWTDASLRLGGLDALRKRIDVRLFILDHFKDAEPYPFRRYQEVVADLGRRFTWEESPHATDFDHKILERIGYQVDEARELLHLDLRAAICECLNPPCAPCDDLCVLLAEVDVHCCKVVSICNLVRTIIITPAVLGYWLPLKEALAELCCCRRSRREPVDTIERLINPFRKAGIEFFGLETTRARREQPSGAQS